ncbi:Crossover junction endonuclease MUS81 [Picochlorum sp. SENEW3]|nr:Crossover junction endonuclease MUS81 [Picochlorum sp. SENEW3]
MAANRHQKEPFAGLAKEADSAAQAVECFPDSFSCIVPSNNILYAFLVEIRKRYQSAPMEPQEEGGDQQQRWSNFSRNIKVAMDSLRDHPLPVFDVESFMLVKGVGPKMAGIVDSSLFQLYPPERPSGEELVRFEEGKWRLDSGLRFPSTSSSSMTAVDIGRSRQDRTRAAEQLLALHRRRGKGGQVPMPVSVGGNVASVVPRAAKPVRNPGSSIVPPAVQKMQKANMGHAVEVDAPDAKRSRVTTKKDYVPKIGTANYTFLIMLYVEQKGMNRQEYLTKDELMHVAEASCLSNKPIFSEGSTAPGTKYTRSFYNGWSSFKSLVNHNLAYSWGNPKKISLTENGAVLAERLYMDAVVRGKIDEKPGLPVHDGATRDAPQQHMDADMDLDSSLLERWEMKQGSQRVGHDVPSTSTREKPFSSLKASIHDRDVIDVISSDEECGEDGGMIINRSDRVTSLEPESSSQPSFLANDFVPNQSSFGRRTRPVMCERDANVQVTQQKDLHGHACKVRLPPLSPGQSFLQEYDIVLLVDIRERYFRTATSRSNGESLESHLNRIRQMGCIVETRTIPVGDVAWVARRKGRMNEEYILDYIVERKSVEDLIQSIKESGRYHNQKYRLKHCGLNNLYYLVEGQVELLSSSSDYKLVCTACAKTSTIDGFRVIRTKNVAQTLSLYKNMTQSITQFYQSQSVQPRSGAAVERCPSFSEFFNHCANFEKGLMTLQDMWAQMLNEVPGLGPEVCASIVQAYPTPAALWKAYKGVPVNERHAVLAQVPMRRTTARGAKVGLQKSKNVFDHLFFH